MKKIVAGLVLSCCFAPLLSLRAQTPDYEIFALQFGHRNHKVAIPSTAVGSTSGDSVNVVFMFWLLKGANGKVILVDAGFHEDAVINPAMITYTRPDHVLEQINIRPGDVTDIILTHPHWDHIGGIDLYPDAKVWMQKKDYEYFVGAAWQENGNKMGFNTIDVPKIVDRNLKGRLMLVEGDNIEIMPGIRVCTGSRHTFESQFVVVGSGSRAIIIASDNAWYYHNLSTLMPIPITHDAKAYSRNLKRMKKMVKDPDLIIPGHDPLVFTKFPHVTNDVVQIKK